MDDLVNKLRTEAARNARMQGDKEKHSCRRRNTFRYRNHMLTAAADRLEQNEKDFQDEHILEALLDDIEMSKDEDYG